MADIVSEDRNLPQSDRLNEADRSLVRAAQTGEGAVVLTPQMMAEMQASLAAREADIVERYPALIKECPYETRLAVTAWVFENLVAHATEGGSFRYLIYDRLGFDADAYVPLYGAGGMTISNEFVLRPAEDVA